MRRVRRFLLGAIFAISFSSLSAHAQTNSFKQTNLASDTAGIAAHTDPNLSNPWGVAFLPGQPFWIANNNGGTSTVYDRNGVSMGTFGVPAPTGSSNPSTPTGIVANVINGIVARFNVNRVASQFIFDTEDGTISGWNGIGSNAILAVDNSIAPRISTPEALKRITLRFNLQPSLGHLSWIRHFRPGSPRSEFTSLRTTK
jgi:hypothetical protein